MTNKLRFTLEQVTDAREQRDSLAGSILDAADATRWYRETNRDVMRQLRRALRAALPLTGTDREVEARLREVTYAVMNEIANSGRPG
jgi:hypothetical protein